MKEMLGNIGSTLAYKLLRENSIKSIKVGRAYKIPKNNIIEYLIKIINEWYFCLLYDIIFYNINGKLNLNC